MNRSIKFPVFILILISIVLSSCQKDVPSKEPVPDQISRFVYTGLKDWYLWYKDVDKFGDNYFPETNDYYKYLNSFGTDYESLFYDLLYQYGTVDRFSWIVDDYTELENSFAGISKSMGFNFRLVRFSGSNDLFGYVRYVLPGYPADQAGIKRGDLFIRVDNQQLTIDNYSSLMFDQETFSLGMATYDQGSNSIGYNGIDRSMTSVEVHENPIFYYTVIDTLDVKTGYLVYNQFNSEYDFDLNNVFSYFKSEGIQRLILDLRYNGGGSVSTCVYLSSMIYSTDINKIFAKQQWNDKIQAEYIYYYGADALNYYFADSIPKTESNPAEAINNLGISDLYVLTTDGTASASELIINSLEPYINVTIVGEQTYGKYVASITVKDWDSQGNVNPSHKWAMQPIVMKTSNVQDVTDYYQGLTPDVPVEEDIVDLKPFGDKDDPLLRAAIDYIQGKKSAPGQPLLRKDFDYTVVADSRDASPFSKDMHIETDQRFLNMVISNQ